MDALEVERRSHGVCEFHFAAERTLSLDASDSTLGAKWAANDVHALPLFDVEFRGQAVIASTVGPNAFQQFKNFELRTHKGAIVRPNVRFRAFYTTV